MASHLNVRTKKELLRKFKERAEEGHCERSPTWCLLSTRRGEIFLDRAEKKQQGEGLEGGFPWKGGSLQQNNWWEGLITRILGARATNYPPFRKKSWRACVGIGDRLTRG